MIPVESRPGIMTPRDGNLSLFRAERGGWNGFVKWLCFVGLLAVFCASVPEATAARSEALVGVSVYDPFQYPSRTRSITGVRLNVFYGLNRNLTGLDLGVLSPITLNTLDGRLTGMQSGFYNQIGKDGLGFQWAAMNYAKQSFTGVQLGVGNITARSVDGMQVGFINRAGTLRGVQIGAFNYTADLTGLQIGFSNLRGRPRGGEPGSAPFRFFPVVNWAF